MRVPVIQTKRDSFMHRRDPRVKVALFILLLVFIYLAPSWVWMAGMVAIGIVLAIASKAPRMWLIVLLLLQVPNIIGLIVIPALGQLADGSLVFDAKLQFGLKLALAWVAAILIGISLISSMEIDELVEGLRGIGVPNAVAFLVGYVFVLAYLGFNDILKIIQGMRLKGVELTPWRPLAFMRGLVQLAAPMIFTVVRRSAQMTAALDLRGFSFAEPKVRRAPLKFDLADASVLVIGLAVVSYAGMVSAELVRPPPGLEEAAKPEKKEG